MMTIYDYEEDVCGPRPECRNGEYCLSAVYNELNQLIIDYRVHPNIFFKYPYWEVVDFAKTSDPETTPYFSNHLEIVQVVFDRDVYTAVIKTYWLRVFQRAWKRYYDSKKVWRTN
jgi:hypothetical protein